jgi:hypothetical protein
MARKNGGKVIQMLSPENYIRTKALTLPLYECWINADWDEAKQAGCIISRKHNNGNITYCFYLVDLLCLGLKYTHFVFNEPLSQYNDFIAQSKEDIALELVDYELVHNVIHAGIEYAEEFEFKPHKDFTTITKYFLEKDADEIEFMEIDCGGDDGQPVYLYSSSTTPVQEKDRIIAHLERIAGPDNYLLLDEDEEIDEDEDNEDNYDDQEDIYTQKSFEENREIFINLFNGLKDSDDPNDLIKLTGVTNALFLKITDSLSVDQYYDELFDQLSIPVAKEEIPNEMLGLKPEDQMHEELYELFMSVFMDINRNLKKARQGLEWFRKVSKGIPAVAFLEVLMIQKENSDKFAETLQKYAREYPDYSLITLIWLHHMYATENVLKEFANKIFNRDTLFPGRDSIHFLEMFFFLMFISKVVAYEKNADKIEAFYMLFDEFDLPERISEIVEESFSLSRIEYLAEYFNLEVT